MTIEEQAKTLRDQWLSKTRKISIPWEMASEQEQQTWKNLAAGGFFPELDMGINVFKTTNMRVGRKRRTSEL